MWTGEDFPGADKVPWQLLVRARFVRELDVVIASTVVNRVMQVASPEVASQVALAASEAMRQLPDEKASGEARLTAAVAVADFLDICPPWPWPRPWPLPGPWPWPGPGPNPGPWPGPWEKISHPMADLVLRGAVDLLEKAASPELARQLSGVLHEAGGF
ncbi:hypothetical protein [Ornithinimicrobium sp. LYQ103]|uniref:hypothetical protein n=1 Tax=Ornithinimicrobium sp. LYQ103 TaxID=3378796 RepID=UPI003851AD8F